MSNSTRVTISIASWYRLVDEIILADSDMPMLAPNHWDQVLDWFKNNYGPDTLVDQTDITPLTLGRSFYVTFADPAQAMAFVLRYA